MTIRSMDFGDRPSKAACGYCGRSFTRGNERLQRRMLRLHVKKTHGLEEKVDADNFLAECIDGRMKPVKNTYALSKEAIDLINYR